MIALESMAAGYGVSIVDAEGFELETARLREALIAVLLAKRDEAERVIDRLRDKPGNPCPHLFKGELRAARYALSVIDRDLGDLRALRLRRVVETTAETVKAVG